MKTYPQWSSRTTVKRFLKGEKMSVTWNEGRCLHPSSLSRESLGRWLTSKGACLGHKPPLQDIAEKALSGLDKISTYNICLLHRLLSLRMPRDKAVQIQGVHSNVNILGYQTDKTVWIAVASEQKTIFPYLKTTVAPGHGGQARRKICNGKRIRYDY